MVRRLKEAHKDGWFDYDSIDNKAKINLLGRLIADCEYFLGYGYGYESHLWAETVEDQIYAMRDLYSQIGDLQDMITEDEIDDYERRMLDVKYNKRKNESARRKNTKRFKENYYSYKNEYHVR